MKKFAEILILGICLPVPLFANFSLFFKPEEQRSLQASTLRQQKKELSLSAIVYLDEKHWTLWINEHAIHSDAPDAFPGILVERVTPDEVTLSYVSSSGRQGETFSLEPELTGMTRTQDASPPQRHWSDCLEP